MEYLRYERGTRGTQGVLTTAQAVYDVTIAYDPPALPRALFKEFFQGAPLPAHARACVCACMRVCVRACVCVFTCGCESV